MKLLLLVFFAGMILCSCSILQEEEEPSIITPDYQLPNVDGNAQKVEDGEDKLDAPSGGGAISIEYTNYVEINLTTKKVSMSYYLPSKSTHNVVLQIQIQDQVLAQSGRIDPGYRLTEMDLLKDAEKRLQVGGYKGYIVVLAYNPTTGEKQMIDTKLEVTIHVKQ